MNIWTRKYFTVPMGVTIKVSSVYAYIILDCQIQIVDSPGKKLACSRLVPHIGHAVYMYLDILGLGIGWMSIQSI